MIFKAPKIIVCAIGALLALPLVVAAGLLAGILALSTVLLRHGRPGVKRLSWRQAQAQARPAARGEQPSVFAREGSIA